MSPRDDVLSVRQMLEHAKEARRFTEGKHRQDLREDRTLELALTRLVEIVGEAANRVSQQFRDSHPSVPWRQAVSMRNRLIHGYDSVDVDVLWGTVDTDFPLLIDALEAIVSKRDY